MVLIMKLIPRNFLLKIAARVCFKKGVEQAKPILLEPIMNVEIAVPEQFMGDIISDLNSKRGRVLGMEAGKKNQVIKAQVPLAEMYRYAIDLKSITQGGGVVLEWNLLNMKMFRLKLLRKLLIKPGRRAKYKKALMLKIA